MCLIINSFIILLGDCLRFLDWKIIMPSDDEKLVSQTPMGGFSAGDLSVMTAYGKATNPKEVF